MKLTEKKLRKIIREEIRRRSGKQARSFIRVMIDNMRRYRQTGSPKIMGQYTSLPPEEIELVKKWGDKSNEEIKRNLDDFLNDFNVNLNPKDKKVVRTMIDRFGN